MLFKKTKKDDIKYRLTEKGILMLAILNYGKNLGYNINNITLEQINDLIEDRIENFFIFSTAGGK